MKINGDVYQLISPCIYLIGRRHHLFKLIFICLGLILLSNASYADDDQDSWKEMNGQNFIIYYRADVPDDFVQTTMDTAEEELSRVTNNLGITDNQEWDLEKQIKIYIYSDKDDFVKSGGQAVWAHGSALAKTRTIKVYPDVSGFFDNLLPHELGHIVFRDYIGLNEAVPTWFEEGVAMYQEKAKRFGSKRAVKEGIEKGQFIPLSQLTGMRLYMDTDHQVVDLFYTESASAVYYLITELGDQVFYIFLDELKKGTPFEEALHKVYLKFRTVDDLNKAWVEYLQD